MTIRVNQLGVYGKVVWSPAAFWAPVDLAGLEAMLTRWFYGMIQVYFKEFPGLRTKNRLPLVPSSGQIDLTYHFIGGRAQAVFPVIMLLLPGSTSEVVFLLGCWLIGSLCLPCCARYCTSMPGICCQPVHPFKAKLEAFLVYQFSTWCELRAIARFVSGRRQGWVPTNKKIKSRSTGRSSPAFMPKAFQECHGKSVPAWVPMLCFALMSVLLLVARQLIVPLHSSALACIPLVTQVLVVLAVYFIYGGSGSGASSQRVEGLRPNGARNSSV